MEIGLIFSAFFAGILTFLAPCTLPLVPAYLSIISGVSVDKLGEKPDAKALRRQVVLNGFYFMAGFSLVFVGFGILAGLFGTIIAPYRVLFTQVGGAIIILFGLIMLGVFKIPFLERVWKPQIHQSPKATKKNAFVIGSAFAFGWAPCVGPILASILLLVSTTSTALQGGLFLLVFSLGLAIPFLLVAFWAGSAFKIVKNISRYTKWVNVIGGAFLILLGLLLVTGNFSLLLSWGYRLFEFVNYDRLVDFL